MELSFQFLGLKILKTCLKCLQTYPGYLTMKSKVMLKPSTLNNHKNSSPSSFSWYFWIEIVLATSWMTRLQISLILFHRVPIDKDFFTDTAYEVFNSWIPFDFVVLGFQSWKKIPKTFFVDILWRTISKRALSKLQGMATGLCRVIQSSQAAAGVAAAMRTQLALHNNVDI